MEHADTEQLAYNLSAFRAGDLVEITLKMHGTSQRTGYLPVLQGYKYKNGLQKRLFESDKTPNWLRSMIERTPIYDWGYVTGTRRVVLDSFDGGFYGTLTKSPMHLSMARSLRLTGGGGQQQEKSVLAVSFVPLALIWKRHRTVSNV